MSHRTSIERFPSMHRTDEWRDTCRADGPRRESDPATNVSEASATTGSVGALSIAVALAELSRIEQGLGSQDGMAKFGLVLARLLIARESSLLVFLACARGLRRLVNAPRGEKGLRLEAIRLDLICAAARDWEQVDPRVRSVILEMEHAGPKWSRIRPAGAARRLTLSPSTLRALFSAQLGRTILEVRRAVVLRGAVRALAETDEHVGQVGYCCGYAHASTFCLDMKRCLGVCPSAFRSLSRTNRRRFEGSSS